jgi:succinyl-CoA synthetase alpha subunit
MNVARDLRALPGIQDAALVMGTEANKRLLAQAGLSVPEMEDATPNDLILVVKGAEKSLNLALERAEEILIAPRAEASAIGLHRPRTIRSAVRYQPDTNLAVIAVPGRYAADEAWAALRQGLHVLLFSDNVPLVDEIALKRYAVENGLLMMGPGAGTAIINGVALGFANVVPRGPVGIVAAAGTGLQEVSTQLAKQDVGISQGIGVGGRDLSAEVGGMMMLHAVEALQVDSETEVIIAISKLPSPTVVDKVLAKFMTGDKPAVVIFLGEELTPPPLPSKKAKGKIFMASTLQEAALAAAMLTQDGNLDTMKSQLEQERKDLREQAQALKRRLKKTQTHLRGLFSGGSLCEEAMRIWADQVSPIWSNVAFMPEYKLPDSNISHEHSALDLGEEEFTIGRPHPMIDNQPRIRRLLEEAHDTSVAVIQLDVVLGYGAHLDPAEELGPAINQAHQIAKQQNNELIVLLSITGTTADPQDINRQRSVFEESGAIVLASNASASYLAAAIVSQ